MADTNNNYNFLKRVENYGDDINNYEIPCELTVTITLNEYRNLVVKNAQSWLEIERRDRQIAELQDEIRRKSTRLKPSKPIESEDDF